MLESKKPQQMKVLVEGKNDAPAQLVELNSVFFCKNLLNENGEVIEGLDPGDLYMLIDTIEPIRKLTNSDMFETLLEVFTLYSNTHANPTAVKNAMLLTKALTEIRNAVEPLDKLKGDLQKITNAL